MNAVLNPSANDAGDLALQIERLGERMEITLAPTAEDAWARVTMLLDRSSRQHAEAGIELLRLKSETSHGEFIRRLDEIHIPRRRASEAIAFGNILLHFSQAAETAVALDDSKRVAYTQKNLQKLIAVSPSRAAALTAIDPEVLEHAVGAGDFDLDEIDCMPIGMLRSEIRRLRGKAERQADQIERLTTENAELRRRLGGSPAGGEHPASVTRARSETAAMADQALAVIAAIERESQILLEGRDLGETRPERQRNIEAAAKPIVLHLASVASSANAAFTAACELLQPWLPEGDWGAGDQPDPLTIEEVRTLADCRDVHVRRMEWEAERREAERISRGEIKRGRGRPRKPAEAPRRRRGRPRKTA